jgi:hypothetical protein
VSSLSGAHNERCARRMEDVFIVRCSIRAKFYVSIDQLRCCSMTWPAEGSDVHVSCFQIIIIETQRSAALDYLFACGSVLCTVKYLNMRFTKCLASALDVRLNGDGFRETVLRIYEQH